MTKAIKLKKQSEINISTPLVTKAIELKKQKVEDQSRDEIKGIKIAREASGDNLQTTRTSSSQDTSIAGTSRELESAEKALEASLPATNIANNTRTDEKQKKEAEETNQKIEANNLNIIASWSSLGGKEGVS